MELLRDLDFSVSKNEIKDLKEKTQKLVSFLQNKIKESRIEAEVFVGGSFAKGTLMKSDDYDVDIFVRFDWKYEKISEDLEKILMRSPMKYLKLHGSRDYFRVVEGKITFEIIPVTKIKKVNEARNVTDLSYFHVNYVKKNLKGKLVKEILIAKKFCKVNGFYGAESYINGFSGYGLECLIINYGKFEKMLKDLVKVKERIILDPARLYKKRANVLFELNESKLKSPIVLIDPTWKERNVLAALNHETFHKFQERAKNYLKSKKKEDFFEVRKFDVSKLEKRAREKKAEFLHVVLETDRQEGDIAGTKMKKFSNYLETELKKYFDVLDREFHYHGEKKSDFYLIAKSKREIIRIGPSLKMKKDVSRFRQKNKKTFVKNGLLHTKIKIDFTAKDFLRKFDKKKMNEMGIIGMVTV